MNPDPQFYMGPANSGAPFHVHNIAVNALIYGRKRWALLPPPAAQYSIRHPTLTFAELDEATAKGDPKGMPSFSTSYGGRLAMMQCVQEAGDILMVPDGWGHSTLNVAESVGWATEYRGFAGWS